TLVFFFQAEDGIRDFHVTGVQTCALPISVNAELEDAPPFSLVLLARRLIGAGSVTALDLKSLEAAGATTVGDALRLSPEVLILHYGRGGAIESIGIKGMGAAQAAIFLDGAPVPAKGAAPLLDAPLAGIERIEIV